MNCPQCQERLDERLDEMRPGLSNGTLSPSDARSQAQKVFQEVVTECSGCEIELRSHLQLRLSLMIPDREIASVAVPPMLRANVRCALERESSSPTYPTRKPFKGFLWTGSMVLSAVALFVVARPFLMERAQITPPSLDTALSPTQVSPTPSASQGKMLRPQVRRGVPAKPPVVGRAFAPKTGSTSVSPPVTRQNPPPASPTPSQNATRSARVPDTATRPPAPRVRSAFSHARPVGGRVEPTHRQNSSNASPSASAPSQSHSPTPREAVPGATPTPPLTPTPMVGMGAPPMVARKRPVAGLIAKPRPKADVVAPSSAALGLTVRFVPPASSLADSDNATLRNRSDAQETLGQTPNLPMVGAAPPMAKSPAPATIAPNMRSRMAPTTPPRVLEKEPDNAALMVPNNAASANSTASEARDEAETHAKGNLVVSVNEAVSQARVLGQVRGRAGEGTVLWSGNAPAHKPIPVPLEPLKANKGDTVDVSFQQQISPEETKTLATTSITLP